jgi:hypothetical protein
MKLLILALSGHASAVFDKYFESLPKPEDKSYKVFAIQSQWDNGGHTGFMLKFYDWLLDQGKISDFGQYMQTFANSHGISLSSIIPPPMGDLKSQIARRVDKYINSNEAISDTIHDLLENISESFASKVYTQSLLERWKQSLDYLKNLSQLRNKPDVLFGNEANINLIDSFVGAYLDFINEGSLNQTNHSIGNLLLSFMYFFAQIYHKRELSRDSAITPHQIFFNLLKDLSLIPEGVYQELLCDGKIQLSGKVGQNTFYGESNFDLAEIVDPAVTFGEGVRVDLSSYTFNAHMEQDGFAIIKFREMLTSSDLLIIPPGSLSNWMPLINRFQTIIKESNKPVVWFPNAFCHISEQDIEEQYNYLNGLFPDQLAVICPTQNAFSYLNETDLSTEEIDQFKNAYAREHKRGANVEWLLQQENVFGLIEYELLDPGIGGIKYEQVRMSEILGMIQSNSAEHIREILQAFSENLSDLSESKSEFKIH